MKALVTTIGFVFTFLSAQSYADLQACPSGQESGRALSGNVIQLTGANLLPGEIQAPDLQFSDPAPPFITPKGEVEIYGPGDYFIRYKDSKEFEKGGCFSKIALPLVNKINFFISDDELKPWDVRKLIVKNRDGRKNQQLVGSMMEPPAGAVDPRWPEDNLSRRVYLFKKDVALQAWTRSPKPIVGDPANGWVGHSYGGNILQAESQNQNEVDQNSSRPIGFFYEKVTAEKNGFPLRTELFVTRLNKDLTATGQETKILNLELSPFPSTKRLLGGLLSEGPRPIEIKVGGHHLYLVGFSSGDYATSSYTMNFLWSESLFGPYRPFLTADQQDLYDFGAKLKAKYHLSWLGRPSPFVNPKGELEILFHAVQKDRVVGFNYNDWPAGPRADQIFRVLFKTKANVIIQPNGEPLLQVSD